MAANLADDIFKCIFLRENDRIPIYISLKFVLRTPIENTPALVQVMAWRWTGNKPLSEPMLTQITDAFTDTAKTFGLLPDQGYILAWFC